MIKVKTNKETIIIVIVSIVFFFIYSWFFVVSNWQTSVAQGQRYIFSWPDAMANNFFIEHFIGGSNFVSPEPLNVVLENIIHPRSVNVLADGSLVPMSFLGFLIVYGLIGQLFGALAVKFLTPLFAVLGAALFYFLIKRIFNSATALISYLLLLTLASFWYYANLVMLPNIFFVFLVISAAYCLVRQNDKLFFSFLSGLAFGLAFITRGMEWPWLAIMIAVPLIFCRQAITMKRVVVFAIGFALPALVLLYVNYLTYDDLWTVGYLNSNNEMTIFERLPPEMRSSANINSESSAIGDFLRLIFLPFGFHPKKMILNFYQYFLKFLAPYVVLFVIGAIAWFGDWRREKKRTLAFVYGLTGLFVCGWLAFYYSNWVFADAMVLKNNTIGSSYVRYWLPLNIIILPYVAYFLSRLWLVNGALIKKMVSRGAVSAIMILLVCFSFNIVYNSRGDGLFDQAEIIKSHYVEATAVEKLIGRDAILITDRTDKLFFPDYKVVDFNLNYNIFPELKKISGLKKIYYFTERPEKDMNYINEKKIFAVGLKFDKAIEIKDGLTLYELVKF